MCSSRDYLIRGSEKPPILITISGENTRGGAYSPKENPAMAEKGLAQHKTEEAHFLTLSIYPKMDATSTPGENPGSTHVTLIHLQK